MYESFDLMLHFLIITNPDESFNTQHIKKK